MKGTIKGLKSFEGSVKAGDSKFVLDLIHAGVCDFSHSVTKQRVCRSRKDG